MSRIAMLTPGISPGDAVSNDITEMTRFLRGRGHEVKIFAKDWLYQDPIEHVSQLSSYLKQKDDVLIYHYAVAWEVALKAFRELPCKKILRYHNVTPPEFFEPYNGGMAQSCRVGRRMVKDFIAAGCELYLPCSDFSGRELEAAGAEAEKIHRVPPFHRVARLQDLEAEMAVIGEYATGSPEPRPDFLMVGRIVPNKGYENLLRAFALYRENFEPEARLIMVGRSDPGLSAYNRLLDELLDEYDLHRSVVFTGGVSDGALKAYYLTASAFVTMSEHEGFCVPLVEAMSMGTPVMALGRAAVPETLGAAGICWEEAEPALFAATFDRLRRDQETAGALAQAGKQRYQENFTNEIIAQRLEAALKNVL